MLNLNKVGRPLCKIEGGKYANMIVSVSDKFASQEEAHDDSLIREFKRLKIPNDSKFQQIQDTTTERQIVYITGPSGSGKSTYTRKLIEQFKKKNKDIPIYMFSALPEDESLDSVQPKRIILDESLIDDPLSIKDFENSIVIFDDIDVLPNKKIREEVYKILNQGLEIGRHHRINMIVTNHLPTNGKDTRRILNECHQLVYFPHSASGRIKYLLIDYLGLDKKMISYFKRQNSRYCVIYKNYPQVYQLQHEIGLLNTFDDD